MEQILRNGFNFSVPGEKRDVHTTLAIYQFINYLLNKIHVYCYMTKQLKSVRTVSFCDLTNHENIWSFRKNVPSFHKSFSQIFVAIYYYHPFRSNSHTKNITIFFPPFSESINQRFSHNGYCVSDHWIYKWTWR